MYINKENKKIIEDAYKGKEMIEKLLNFHSNSEIYIDNDLNANHCYDRECYYVKEKPTNKQPCTCLDFKYIRLVNLDSLSDNTNIKNLYYQLGHELGHQWFRLQGNKFIDETCACYTALVVLHRLLDAEEYLQECVRDNNIYKLYNINAFILCQKHGFSLDKDFILNEVKSIYNNKK